MFGNWGVSACIFLVRWLRDMPRLSSIPVYGHAAVCEKEVKIPFVRAKTLFHSKVGTCTSRCRIRAGVESSGFYKLTFDVHKSSHTEKHYCTPLEFPRSSRIWNVREVTVRYVHGLNPVGHNFVSILHRSTAQLLRMEI